jgi:hypothetical protein
MERKFPEDYLTRPSQNAVAFFNSREQKVILSVSDTQKQSEINTAPPSSRSLRLLCFCVYCYQTR